MSPTAPSGPHRPDQAGHARQAGPTTKGNPMNDLIAQYLDCWNETDPAARRKLIEGTWAPDASYIGPLAEAHGRDAIDATIAAAQAQFPGFVFSLAGPVGVHHQQARFAGGVGPGGAEPPIVGFDVVRAPGLVTASVAQPGWMAGIPGAPPLPSP